MYNLTNVTSANTLDAIFLATNDLAGGGLFAALLLIYGVVYITAFKKQSLAKVMIGANFVLGIVGTIAFLLDYVKLQVLMAALILMFLSIPLMMMQQYN